MIKNLVLITAYVVKGFGKFLDAAKFGNHIAEKEDILFVGCLNSRDKTADAEIYGSDRAAKPKPQKDEKNNLAGRLHHGHPYALVDKIQEDSVKRKIKPCFQF